MSTTDLPRQLPGDVREGDDALNVAGLDSMRAKIAAHIDDTQGAWRRAPAWRRLLPLAIGLASALAWTSFLAVSGLAHGVSVAALLAYVAALGAFFAVARAPAHPAFSETAARFALALGCVALCAEIGASLFATAPVAGDDIECARAILMGSAVPSVSLAIFLRLSRAPARFFHVAALAGAAVLASSATVWVACASLERTHVLVAHIGVPLALAGVVIAICRPLLRGPRLR
ncbi:MAG TPA: hypothetical protein VGO62_14350 [Myxococcota bacterium]